MDKQHKVKIVPGVGWTLPEWSLASDPVGSVHERLKAQSWKGGYLVFKPQGLISVFLQMVWFCLCPVHNLQRALRCLTVDCEAIGMTQLL